MVSTIDKTKTNKVPVSDFSEHLAHLNLVPNQLTYKNFVPLMVGNGACHAMVDSGNLFCNVMSKEFMQQLGLTTADLVPVPGLSHVGTAKEGEGLRVLGRVRKPLSLTLAGCPTKFNSRPVVLDGLTICLLYTSPSPRDKRQSRMPSSA